jgi:hypothetical protein
MVWRRILLKLLKVEIIDNLARRMLLIWDLTQPQVVLMASEQTGEDPNCNWNASVISINWCSGPSGSRCPELMCRTRRKRK